MNYGELRQALANYCHRDDLTDQIRLAIALAEIRINGDLKVDELVRWLNVTVTGETFNLPPGFIQARAVLGTVNGKARPLEGLTPTQYFQRRPGLTGNPSVYSVFAGNLSVWPAPSAAASLGVDLIYYAKPAALTSDTDSNAVLSAYPNVFIYAGMVELAPYNEDAEALPVWAELYKQEVRRINAKAASKEMGGTAPMMRAS